MTEFMVWVKRVSHANRVSSNKKPAKFLGMFFVAAILIFWNANPIIAFDITSSKVIDLANADRKGKGIPEIAENEKLSRAAARKAEDMVLHDYFSHTSPQGVTPWRWIEKEDYDYDYAGENLAMDFTSAAKMNDAWMASPTHRANILNEKYKEIGVAIKDGIINGHATTVVVQMFGSGDKKAPDAFQEKKTDESFKKKETLNENQEDYIPNLPGSGERLDKILLASPLITSPQGGEILNEKKIYVVGRADSQSRVTILDGESIAGYSVADEKGWFKLEIENISEGSHSLTATTSSFAAGKIQTKISEKVSIIIDHQKPSLDYRLQPDNQKNSYIVSLSSEKKNCNFQLGEEKASGGFGSTAIFSIKTSQSSIVATVSDRAGNKVKRQIFLANYFAGDKRSFLGSFAFSLSDHLARATDSGREALAVNLGMTPR